jgi:hypothetical protein
MMRLSAFIATSSAWMDFSRPTNNGMTMCGYTTTSRSGSTGNPWMTTDLEDGEVSVTRQALEKPRRREMQRRGWI